MAARVEKIFTALDIGSSKISAMIAGRMDNGELTVLGTGQRASKGVKRGYIADTETTELDVRDAVEQAERIAGTNIDDVWVTGSSRKISICCSTPGAPASIPRARWCCTLSRLSTRSMA